MRRDMQTCKYSVKSAYTILSNSTLGAFNDMFRACGVYWFHLRHNALLGGH